MVTRHRHAAWGTIALTGSLKKQKVALDAKITGVSELRRDYERVFAYQHVETTLAAGFEIGRTLENFAAMLWQADIPFPQGTQEHELYVGQLHEVALPLHDEALAHYRKIVQKALQVRVITPEVREADARLRELDRNHVSKLPDL